MKNEILSSQKDNENDFQNNISPNFLSIYNNHMQNKNIFHNQNNNNKIEEEKFQNANNSKNVNINLNNNTLSQKQKINYQPYKEYIDKEINLLNLKMRCDLINHKLNKIKFYINDDYIKQKVIMPKNIFPIDYNNQNIQYNLQNNDGNIIDKKNSNDFFVEEKKINNSNNKFKKNINLENFNKRTNDINFLNDDKKINYNIDNNNNNNDIGQNNIIKELENKIDLHDNKKI